LTRERQSLGRAGENRAATFLEGQGYRIVERNVRSRLGEIDIVAERDGELFFVEVKTASSAPFGPPLYSVGSAKQARLVRLAAAYIRRRSKYNGYHFSVIAIASERDEIEWLPDAFVANSPWG
jgi:putative endonuclease